MSIAFGHFANARACFKENIDRLPVPSTMGKPDAILWNLSKGLLDLTVAVESRLDDLDARVANLERKIR